MDNSFEKTHQCYEATLDQALSHFRALLGSSGSPRWRPIQPTVQPAGPTLPFNGGAKGKGRETLNGLGTLDFGSVRVHKRSAKGADVVRAVAEVPVDLDRVDVDDFRSVLQTPEVRGAWDRLVDKAGVVELLDPRTRIAKTDFRLGWPANPRDTITICKTLSNSTTIIDIASSLPRSADEPAYLRPSPPFVRAHVLILAWCVQIINPTSTAPNPDSEPAAPSSPRRSEPPALPEQARARISVFWQVNWKGAIFSTHHAHIASLLAGFIDYVRTQADRIPLVAGYGIGVEFGSTQYDPDEERLEAEYSIVADEAAEASCPEGDAKPKTLEEAQAAKERRRLERAVELRLPMSQGWDVNLEVKAQGDGADEAWAAVAERPLGAARVVLRFNHASLDSPHHLVRAKVSVQRLAGGRSLRVNGNLLPVVPVGPRDLTPSASFSALDESSSIRSLSLQMVDTSNLTGPMQTALADAIPATLSATPPSAGFAVRTPVVQAAQITPLLRRSYIYFTSLLQEPDAKWRHISDSRGVTVTQLKSIDPTLTIYRAEATFVGVGVWDLFSAVTTAGARSYWDRSLSETTLLEDVNELSSLWHSKTKATWPAVPRDSVSIRTAYRSPASVHVFSFSTDDSVSFPSIPPPEAGTIRVQTDLQGWSIEALSPTTTQITLIDQTDPKGWTPKSWIPSQLVAQVSGVGEFTIKSGGPPLVTRVLRAKVSTARYEHEKGAFRMEYVVLPKSVDCLAVAMPTDGSINDLALAVDSQEGSENVECEIRCDTETWAPGSLDLVVDPPPTKVSCLSRHRLSSGGGCWITIEHAASEFRPGEKLRVLIRRGPAGREKGSVHVNGMEARIDVEELPDDEVELLSKRRRIKAMPIPLDQYPLTGPKLWRSSSAESTAGNTPSHTPTSEPVAEMRSLHIRSSSTGTTRTGHVPPPILVASKAPAPLPRPESSPRALPPIAYALEALARLQALHVEQGPNATAPPAGWTLVAEKGTASVYKKLVPPVSEAFSVYRVDKVIEGVTAEELVTALSLPSLRPRWDDRMGKLALLESYGHGCTTSVLHMKPAFLFKGRLLRLATVSGYVQVPSVSATSSTSTVYFIASASFPCPPDSPFVTSRLNPQGFVEAKILLEGWIVETLDPYSSGTHAIPSTRCTYFSCIEYGGSLPTAFNSMLDSSLPRLLMSLEALVKADGPFPRIATPRPALRIEGPLSVEGMSDWEWRLAEVNPTSCAVVAAAGPPYSVSFVVNRGAKPAASSRSSSRLASVLPPLRPDGVRGRATDVAGPFSPQSDLRNHVSVGQPRRSGVSPVVGERTLSELVIGELVIDQKHFANGYDVSWTSSFAPENASAFDLDATHDSARLPLAVVVHEIPSPPVFAASLDPTAQRRHHLLRFSFPSCSTVDASGNSAARDGAPEQHTWHAHLLKRDAIVRVTLTSRQSVSDDQKMRITVNDQPVEVMGIRETQASLDRWEDEDFAGLGASISRVTRKVTSETSSPSGFLPPSFRQPIAVSSAFLPQPAIAATSPTDPSHAGTPKLLSPAGEDAERPKGSQGSPPDSITHCSQPRNGSLTPLTGVLGNFPIQHLGAATTAALTRPTYSLRHLVMTALIFFLLGSLLRSLLLPADFFVIPSGASESEARLLSSLGSKSHWREARRLLELRWLPFTQHWSVVIAIVRRQGA